MGLDISSIEQPFSILDLAKICNEALRAVCEINGDHSQKPWEEAEEWQRQSIVAGVIFQLAYQGEHGHINAEASHEAWSADKLKNGWKWGEQKNPLSKTHPCLVPFAELPANQRAKDHLVAGIVFVLRPFVRTET